MNYECIKMLVIILFPFLKEKYYLSVFEFEFEFAFEFAFEFEFAFAFEFDFVFEFTLEMSEILDKIPGNLGAETLIMTMMWLMVTGLALWLTDNLMKNLENPMEDGFKHQARVLNRSMRVNFAVILVCLSAYAYITIYLKKDIQTLPHLLQNIMWVLASVGKFLLHLLSYIVYWGQNTAYPDNPMPKPEADQSVLVGFIVLIGYIVVRRVVAEKMSPAVWALLIIFIIVIGTYFTNKNPDLLDNFTKRKKKTTQVDSLSPSNIVDVNTNTNTDEVIKEREENLVPVIESEERAIPTVEKTKDRLLKELYADIELFIRDYEDHLPQEEKYDDPLQFVNDITKHDQDIKTHVSYKNILDICNALKEKMSTETYKKQVAEEIIQIQLCPNYGDIFLSSGLCQLDVDKVFAY